MKRLHISLSVADLDASVGLHSTVFGDDESLDDPVAGDFACRGGDAR